jgi:ribosome-associated protein
MAFRVPDDELEFRASRAGGPGGQHVNTSATRVEALWNVARSASLSREQRDRLFSRLAKRIDATGTLRVVAAERRSQYQNRVAAAERLRALVAAALHQPKRRRKTRPPRAAVEARLAAKRRRGSVKRERRLREDD